MVAYGSNNLSVDQADPMSADNNWWTTKSSVTNPYIESNHMGEHLDEFLDENLYGKDYSERYSSLEDTTNYLTQSLAPADLAQKGPSKVNGSLVNYGMGQINSEPRLRTQLTPPGGMMDRSADPFQMPGLSIQAPAGVNKPNGIVNPSQHAQPVQLASPNIKGYEMNVEYPPQVPKLDGPQGQFQQFPEQIPLVVAQRTTDKAKIRRARNTEAVRRSRARTLHRITELEQLLDFYAKENLQLKEALRRCTCAQGRI